MAIRKNQAGGNQKQIQARLQQVGREKAAWKKKLKSPTGGLQNIGPVDLALLVIVLALDVVLGLASLLSIGLFSLVEWVIKIIVYAFVGLISFALIFTSRLQPKDYPVLIAMFFLSLAIEVIPLVSILPAMSFFLLRVISAINKAKIKRAIDELDKEIKQLQQQLSAGKPRPPVQKKTPPAPSPQPPAEPVAPNSPAPVENQA